MHINQISWSLEAEGLKSFPVKDQSIQAHSLGDCEVASLANEISSFEDPRSKTNPKGYLDPELSSSS